ncbi:MAG: histone deacetylase [Gammaproteobacteria bacterium]|nr:histone deacetylase [Gammaproteobacteria bacterium]
MHTGLVYDSRFRDHDTGPYHPEQPARMDAALAAIEQAPWQQQLHRLATRAADITDVERCHRLDYIRRAQRECAAGAPFIDTTDVTISAASCDVALLAAGAPLVLADALVAGEIDNGFALVRPPGHHAERAAAMGFCLFNNVAILARYLQRVHGLDKIAILDWDVHHGNGTQHCFEEDPSVLYVSLHQYPYYPGTGAYSETGIGRGAGSVLNCPMPAGATDSAYERAFQEQVLPTLDLFKPECLIVSAGFDGHRDDPLADIQLSTEMYGWMSERVLETADLHCEGRLLSVLEGGYNLERLGECVSLHLAHLAGVA